MQSLQQYFAARIRSLRPQYRCFVVRCSLGRLYFSDIKRFDAILVWGSLLVMLVIDLQLAKLVYVQYFNLDLF